MKLICPNLFFALILILFISCLGTLGYYLMLPDMGWVDALYITAITLSTVEYGEVAPMISSAKIFTILLIMVGLTAFAFGIKELIHFVITENILIKSKKKLIK